MSCNETILKQANERNANTLNTMKESGKDIDVLDILEAESTSPMKTG